MSHVTAREAILSAVRAARPPRVAALPPRAPRGGQNVGSSSLVDAFAGAATAAGAVVIACPSDEVAQATLAASTGAPRILSLIPGLSSTVSIPADPHALRELSLFACEAALGVAENGAVWVSTSEAWVRAGLFLAERVVIVVDHLAIVPDLHDAYGQLAPWAHPFGTFIAGPSKTADIEQSLVVGAHGPRELTVIIAGSSEATAPPPR